jgi:hypothetical protein
MRRLLLGVVLACAVTAATPGLASASHSQGNGPKFQKANGTGFSEGYGLVHVNAKNKDGPSGHFFIEEAQAQGEVTCFGASGSDAVIGGTDRDDGRPFLIFVHDEGEPGHEGDAHSWRPALPPEVALCEPLFPPPDNIERGNYIVHSG